MPHHKNLPFSSTRFIILAAGQSQRMLPFSPKILHPICGKPILWHILHTLHKLPLPFPITLVIGDKSDQIINLLHTYPKNITENITIALQKKPLGTAHALQVALHTPHTSLTTSLVVIPGDTPLLDTHLLQNLLLPLKKSVRLISTILLDPTGYGRILYKHKSIQKIIEEKDATLKEKKISRINAGLYHFQTSFLKKNLPSLSNHNQQKEFYLTDIVEIAAQQKQLEEIFWPDTEALLGVNDPWQAMEAEKKLCLKICKQWALKGVRFLDATSVFIDPLVTISPGCIIGAQVCLKNNTHLAPHVILEKGVTLEDTTIEAHSHIKQGSLIFNAHIGSHCSIGPYAHIRPQSVLKENVKIGNFVELKQSTVEKNTKIPHLSYVGDASIGQSVNIGCGFITCNYDGYQKHPTVIKDNAFIGSACKIIAPATLHTNSYIASGTTITEDVPADALAIGRSKQINKPDYAIKLKKRFKKAAQKTNPQLKTKKKE